MSITKEIIKECYWDAHMTPQDLENIVASQDNRELEKLFSKIIYNSKDKLKALRLFSKEQLVYLFSNFQASYNKKYIEKHILVLRVLLLDEKHEIKELEWKKIENLEITESDIEKLSLYIVSGQDNSLYQKGK